MGYIPLRPQGALNRRVGVTYDDRTDLNTVVGKLVRLLEDLKKKSPDMKYIDTQVYFLPLACVRRCYPV